MHICSLHMTFLCPNISQTALACLHLGHLVETGSKEEIFENPVHPYTAKPSFRYSATNPVWKSSARRWDMIMQKSGIRYRKRHSASCGRHTLCAGHRRKKLPLECRRKKGEQ